MYRPCVTGVPFSSVPLAFSKFGNQNQRVDATAALSSALAGVNAGSSIAVAVLTQTEHAQAEQVATLFSSIGLGANVSTSA